MSQRVRLTFPLVSPVSLLVFLFEIPSRDMPRRRAARVRRPETGEAVAFGPYALKMGKLAVTHNFFVLPFSLARLGFLVFTHRRLTTHNTRPSFLHITPGFWVGVTESSHVLIESPTVGDR